MQSDIQEFLNQETWAVVGASTDPAKYGNKVYHKLKNCGYKVYPINPKLTEINGDPCFAKLKDLPLLPDVVSVIVPPQVTEQIVEECAQLGIQRIWMQPGAESPEAIRKGDELGLKIIHNDCVLVQARVKK